LNLAQSDLIVSDDAKSLTLRILNGVMRIPEIVAALQGAGFHLVGMRMRQNTLEDVFIQLTGRGLRE
jgi:ABC-2 type transport system ATP-binding protein